MPGLPIERALSKERGSAMISHLRTFGCGCAVGAVGRGIS
jgi:hypothetical protein